MTTKTSFPFGRTPASEYATWNEHREAMRREAEEYRLKGEAIRKRRLAAEQSATHR